MQRSISAGSALNKSPTLPSGTTASASFQSHLSTANSAHRLRTLPGPPSDLEKQLDTHEGAVHNPSATTSSPNRLKVVEINSRIKWTFVLYACFSAIFLPVSVLQTFGYLSCGLVCAIRGSDTSAYYAIELRISVN